MPTLPTPVTKNTPTTTPHQKLPTFPSQTNTFPDINKLTQTTKTIRIQRYITPNTDPSVKAPTLPHKFNQNSTSH